MGVREALLDSQDPWLLIVSLLDSQLQMWTEKNIMSNTKLHLCFISRQAVMTIYL